MHSNIVYYVLLFTTFKNKHMFWCHKLFYTNNLIDLQIQLGQLMWSFTLCTTETSISRKGYDII